MAAVAAANESELQAAAAAAALEPPPTPAAAAADARPLATLLDPRLLMAARRGDSKALKDLLQLNDDDDQQGQDDTRPDDEGSATQQSTTAAASTTTSVVAAPSISQPHVILEVDDSRRHDAVAAQLSPPPVPVLDENGVPIEGDSLLIHSGVVQQQVVEPPPHDDVASPAAAALAGAVPALNLNEDGAVSVTMEGDSLLHVVAACGDGEEYLHCAKMIVSDRKHKGGAAAVRLALEARNSKGDTPLHCAAAAGNANIISCLVDLIANDTTDEEAAAVKKAFLRTQNECGETALHQAVRAADNKNKVDCIDQLLAMDPELACIPHEDGASPLYLAISLGEIEVAEHLYVKSKGKLSYSGPDGRNVLHAAVYHGGQDGFHKFGYEDRNQPLGCYWMLTNPRADDEGSYPIHVAAASSNSLGIVKMLLERCPDCATLRDGKGRTFLHVAAEEGRRSVVGYVCGEMPHRLSSMILNAQDNNGDTALHGAVRAGNLAVFNCLFQNRQVRLDVANKDEMTPLDLSWIMIPPGFQYTFNRRRIVRSSLFAAGAQHGGGRPELFRAKHILKKDVDKESKKQTETAQVMSIVTALIATVTFASAFRLPGGYRADGEPVLAGSYAFDAFILADALAFICSISATYSLVYAGMPPLDIDERKRYLNVSLTLMQSAARSLVAAFGLGLYLLLAPFHHTTMAIAACSIVFASSLYGNIEAWRSIRMAITVLARIGIRRYALVRYAGKILFGVSVHFGSYIIIFGFPVIRKWVHQKQF